jgi:hypothetical protein
MPRSKLEKGLGQTKRHIERTRLTVKKGDNNVHEFILRNFYPKKSSLKYVTINC